jgi:hypothetical protein
LADSDSGDVWISYNGQNFSLYSWVYDTFEEVVFGKETIIKAIKSGPLHPDSGGTEFWDTEQYFARGFGIIYHKEEPYGEVFLRGCIIDSDTF